MDRLTVKVFPNDKDYVLKCMCGFARNGEVDDVDSCGDVCSLRERDEDVCEGCGFQEAFNRLAAYEDTELAPESVVALKRMYKDRDDALMRARRGNEALERQLAKLKEENARLRELLGKIENIFTERENNEN